MYLDEDGLFHCTNPWMLKEFEKKVNETFGNFQELNK